MRPAFGWLRKRPDWRPLLRRCAPWLLPLGMGSALFALFGVGPARLERASADSPVWTLSLPPARDTARATADAVWAGRHPWGGRPAAEAAAAAPPPPVPVAIVSTASGHEVVFVVPGAGETRTRAGGALPDGGRVESVDALSVVWIDGQGQRQEQRLLADRQRPLSPPP